MWYIESSSLRSVVFPIALFAVGLAGVSVDSRAQSSTGKLEPPSDRKIRVAFVITHNANVIDMTGPWEVFQDVMVTNGEEHDHPFELYTVSDDRKPVQMTAGLMVVPDYTFADAPEPDVIVVGAQVGSPGMLEWLKTKSALTDVTMSVCTGAFQLAKAGLLDGLQATTHHDFFDAFEKAYPNVDLQRGLRFVEGSVRIATAGGLTSGFDMALRVVERYFGAEVAEQTAVYMEYQRSPV